MAKQPVAVVTGPTSGIGQWIALGLARAHYDVVLVARDDGRAAATREWISARVPDATMQTVLADLALMGDARRAAAEIAAAHPRLALLVNNAGLITRRRELTAEGRETILAVNHLAPFVLTRELEPALRAGAPARAVNIGSEASDRAELRLDDLEGARGWRALRAYGQSKLALLMASIEWARRFEGSGVTVNVVHPGLVATNIANRGGLMGVGWDVVALFALSAEKGADGPLHVALSPEVSGVTGRYFKRRTESRPNPVALDADLRARLWGETERLIR